jgi:hypothetical protein
MALDGAKEPGINSLDNFYNCLDDILTHIPTEEELMPSVRKFYYVLGRSPKGGISVFLAFELYLHYIIGHDLSA